MGVDRTYAIRQHRRFMDSWFKLDRNYCRLLKRWDISINTLWVLEHLQRHPEGGEPAVLADQVNMLRQTMTLTLDQLEKRGYLCRTPHKTDRRRKIVTLTPPGQAFAAEVLDVVTGFELAAMEALTGEELEALVENSVKYQEAFEKSLESESKNGNGE